MNSNLSPKKLMLENTKRDHKETRQNNKDGGKANNLDHEKSYYNSNKEPGQNSITVGKPKVDDNKNSDGNDNKAMGQNGKKEGNAKDVSDSSNYYYSKVLDREEWVGEQYCMSYVCNDHLICVRRLAFLSARLNVSPICRALFWWWTIKKAEETRTRS